MDIIQIQNELFKLLGVKDGDPRYSDCLLVASYVEKLLHAQNKAVVERAIKSLPDKLYGGDEPEDVAHDDGWNACLGEAEAALAALLQGVEGK